MPLNNDQKRFLAAALTEVKENLLRFERLLRTDDTINVPNPLPPEQRTKLLELIAAFKKQLQTIKNTFRLPTKLTDCQPNLLTCVSN